MTGWQEGLTIPNESDTSASPTITLRVEVDVDLGIVLG